MSALIGACANFDASGFSQPMDEVDSGAPVDGPMASGDALMAPTDGATSPDAPCLTLGCNFAFRRAISIDVSRITTTLADIPVLVSLDQTRIDYNAVQPNGEDIRFVSLDGSSTLAYEIESWDANGTSFVWLLIPELAPAPQPHQLWMYYGDPQAVDAQDPSSVWKSEFVSVHHLSGDHGDSTLNGHDGVTPNPPTEDDNGPIGGAYSFDGVNDFIELPGEAAYDFTTEMSASLWFKVDEFDEPWQALLTKGDHSWRLHRTGTGSRLSFSTTTNQGMQDNHISSLNVEDGDWHHVLVSYNGAVIRLYIDGAVEVSVAYSEPIAETDHPVYIGENSEIAGRFFAGSIDEVRVAEAPRSRDWARVEYLSVVDESFIVVGPEEAP